MKVSFLRFLLLSIVLHGLILASLFWIKNDNPKKQIVTIEYTPEQIPKTSPKQQSLAAGIPKKKKNSLTIGKGQSALDKFRPKLNFDSASGMSVSSSSNLLDTYGDTFGVSPNKDNPNALWGSGSASFGRVQDYLL